MVIWVKFGACVSAGPFPGSQWCVCCTDCDWSQARVFLLAHFLGQHGACVVQTVTNLKLVLCFCRPISWITGIRVCVCVCVCVCVQTVTTLKLVLCFFAGPFPGSLVCVCAVQTVTNLTLVLCCCRPISWVTVVCVCLCEWLMLVLCFCWPISWVIVVRLLHRLWLISSWWCVFAGPFPGSAGDGGGHFRTACFGRHGLQCFCGGEGPPLQSLWYLWRGNGAEFDLELLIWCPCTDLVGMKTKTKQRNWCLKLITFVTSTQTLCGDLHQNQYLWLVTFVASTQTLCGYAHLTRTNTCSHFASTQTPCGDAH